MKEGKQLLLRMPWHPAPVGLAGFISEFPLLRVSLPDVRAADRNGNGRL